MGIESTENLLWLIFVLPLIGAAGLLLAGRRADRWGHIPAIILAAASFALSLAMCIGMAGREVADRAAHQRLFSWVPVGELQVDFGLQLDQLSVCFVLLITGVGTLIHIYSVGYMADDPDRRKFFAFLNLFLAAMLLLVLADNYLGLYLGWEGVGLASYLLIGFWQHRPAAATAAKKAFVVNRVGDVGLAIGLMIMFATFGAVSFEAVFSGADAAGQGVLTALGFVLLLAACGKSAQVPLQSWLGDAMEGPTPVSALIHAATMVTAGVYLITRSAAIFDRAPAAQIGVVVVGAVTLLFGAIIGCAKDDIKKALAASTMSQIGYMVLAAGLGPAGYAFAILHLLTHGFFKAGLFLGAGSVMHAMDDETDMRRYGGLRRVLPITFATFGLGYLALIGVPPLSGFFSKDHIIEVAFGSPGAKGLILGLVTLIGAGLTAFYMTRVMAMTFFGKPRWSGDPSPHEAPPSMTGPMILLAIGSVAAGWLLAAGDTLVDWLTPVTAAHPAPGLISTGHDGVLDLPTWAMTVIILAVVAAGVALGWQRYRGEIPVTAPADVSPLTVAARRDLYGDTVNEQLLMLPGRQLTTNLVALEDYGIDGFTDAVGSGVQETSSRLRGWQSGYVRSYALSTFAGALLVVATVMVVTLI